MPLFKYKCKNNHSIEELFLGSEKVKAWMKCHCGKRASKQISLIANMNAAWAEQAGTTSEFFSPSLGTFCNGKRDEEKQMKDKGFIPESSLPSFAWEDETQRRVEKEKEVQTYTNKYKKALSSGKTKEEAVSETFTSSECLDGTVSKVYSE